jgi:hypothetical protein
MCDRAAKLALMAVVCAAGCGRMGYGESAVALTTYSVDSGIAMDASPQSMLLNLSSETTWQHTVGDADGRILLVTATTNWWNTHPTEIIDNGAPMEKVQEQDALTWGAVALWRTVSPSPGQHTITVRYSLPQSAILRSASFSGVDPKQPMSEVQSGTHDGADSQTVTSRSGDLAVAIVSWAFNQVTDWLTNEVELSGSAATHAGGPQVDFTWQPTGTSSLSGAHMLFSLRAPD